MIEWLLKFLERHGRKYAFVDFYGDILSYRYYVLYYEPHHDTRWLAKFPNIWMHVFPGEPTGWAHDGKIPHSHAWSALAIVWRGQYTDLVNNVRTRATKALGFAFTSYKDDHRITHVAPGTHTIFIHGFRRKDWTMVGYRCKEVCQECKDYHGGKCSSQSGAYSFPAIDPDKTKRWRAMTLMQVNDKLPALLKARKNTLRRLGVEIPDNTQEKYRLGTIRALKEMAKEKTECSNE